MSSTGNAECPATPVRPTTKQHHEDNASTMASPSVMSSPGNTIDTESFPSTPSQVTQRSGGVPLTRRRGKTTSSIGDAALLDHAIFALSNVGFNDVQEQADVFASINDKQDRESVATEVEAKIEYRDTLQRPVVVSSEHYATKDAGTTRDESAVEEPEEEGAGDEAQEATEEDLKDLARYGLPSACVFVANLAATQTDDQLLHSLQAHFGKFGRLHVKIRRDAKGNPYSFCQFESDEAARQAVREGRNAIIDPSNRRIRCEPAKVNRTLVLSKHDCSTFDEQETRKILFGFGGTESLEFSSGIYTLPIRGIKEGKRCFVRFAFRQDAVDCYQYFRFHSTWTADWTSNFSAPNTIPRIQAVEIDPASIFIGKLNADAVNEDELRARFARYGVIVECNLVNRPGKNGIGRNAFAFIKYETEENASQAMERENGTQFQGKTMHVQKREIHKKNLRPNPPAPRGSGLQMLSHLPVINELGMPGLNPLNPSFSFSLREVADLAARLSVQIADQRDMSRRQSMASIVSGPALGMPNFPFSPDAMASRRGSYQPMPPMHGVTFNQPFQQPYAAPRHITDPPMSPRATNGQTPGPVADHQGLDGLNIQMMPSEGNRQPFTPEYFSQVGQYAQSPNDPYSGSYPPHLPPPPPPNFANGSHLMPPPPQLIDIPPHHRDSVASMGYDSAGMYGQQTYGVYPPPGGMQ